MAKTKANKILPKWKTVEISGNLINGTNDFEGFAGLEVLENYDDTFLKGDLTKIQKSSTKRAHFSDDSESDFESEEEKPLKKKKAKKAKQVKEKQEHTPGKFVLLKPQDAEEEDEVSEDPESSKIRTTWNEVGVFSDEIIKALTEMKFESPTEIQRATIPVSIYGKCDILGASRTGSGKTLAFGIPIVQNIQKFLKEDGENRRNLYSLILTPTRELAQQIQQHLKAIAKYTDVTIACVIGGLATVKQERILKTNPNIVIGTPGRIWELIQDGNEHLQKIGSLRHFVVDETDRMVEKGHFAELEEILTVLNNSEHKEKRQTFVFSATLTMVKELPQHFKKKKKKPTPALDSKDRKLNEFIFTFGMNNPKIFDLSSDNKLAAKLTESRILCSLDEKDFYLYYILATFPGRTVVFCNSIECVKRLSSVLMHLNITPIILHGKMEQKHRLKNLESFQKHEDSILVATQVAARGLDIPNIQHVIHYQVPTSGEDYVHRSGRTARADKEGLSILLMEEKEVKFFVKLQKTLGRNEDLPIFPTDSRIMKNVREQVRLARDIENLDLQIRRASDNRSWKKKAANDIGILDDSEDSENESRSNREHKQLIQALKQKKVALGKLLSAKIVPSNIQSLKFPIGPENSSTFESNPIEAVKDLVARKKKNQTGIKLYRKKKSEMN